MIRLEPRLKVKAGPLEIVPAISLLFLLMFFMLLSTSVIFEHGLKVELPQAQAAYLQKSEKLVVSLIPGPQGKAAKVFLNYRPSSWEELDQRFNEIVRSHSRLQGQEWLRPTISVRAGRKVLHEDLMRVIDLALRMKVKVTWVCEDRDKLPGLQSSQRSVND